MFLDNEAASLMASILARKEAIERNGGNPRIILLGEDAFGVLEADWFEALEDYPGGDEITVSMKRRRIQGKTSPDGTMFGLAVFKVDTLKGFEVY